MVRLHLDFSPDIIWKFMGVSRTILVNKVHKRLRNYSRRKSGKAQKTLPNALGLGNLDISMKMSDISNSIKCVDIILHHFHFLNTFVHS